jgi:hypothetical protein
LLLRNDKLVAELESSSRRSAPGNAYLKDR